MFRLVGRQGLIDGNMLVESSRVAVKFESEISLHGTEESHDEDDQRNHQLHDSFGDVYLKMKTNKLLVAGDPISQ